MSKPRFLYINPPKALEINRSRPDVELFSNFFKLYGAWVLPIDRTGTLLTPFRTKSLYPMPKFRVFQKSYEEICNDRAKEVLAQGEKLGKDMYVFYSGGIDSTCMLVSLLKNASPSQKKMIVVLLSQESIMENPRFFEEHIRGNLRVESSTMFPYILGTEDFVLSGENNDQVMGSDKVGRLILTYGTEAIHQPYKRDTYFEFFGGSWNHDPHITNFYLDLFEKLRDTAPVRLETNFEYLWWINFALKWQAVVMYTLMFAAKRNIPNIKEDYMRTHYTSFYNTEDFQLWSMNNLDKRIKDTWPSYKWISKEVIFDFTKDEDYFKHKTKKGSRAFITRQQTAHQFLDEHMRYNDTLDPKEYLEERNDFVV